MGRYNVASNDKLLHSTFPARGDSDEKLGRKINRRLSGPKSPLQKAISLEVPDIELFPTDATTSISRSVDLPPWYPSPSRHSTACCTSLADRQELQKLVANGGQLDQSAFNSFRSEDSRDRENLALWEEKEHNLHPTTSGELGWLKQIGAQSPWRESVSQAVKKFETFSQGVGSNKQAIRSPWRCSPNHAKSADAPRKWIDRKVGATSPWRDLMVSPAVRTNDVISHEGLKSWYTNSSGKCTSGELGSGNSPASASKMSRQSGSCELKPSLAVVAKKELEQFNVDHQLVAEQSRESDFETVPGHVARFATEEDTRISSSAIAWDVSCKPDPVTKGKPRLLTGISWELPIEPVMDSDHDSENIVSESAEDPEHPALTIEDDTRRPSSAIAWGTLNKSTEQSPTRAPGAVPFHWEDVPGKPKTIAAAAEIALARKLSKEGMEGLANSLERIGATKKSQSLDESMFSQITASEAGGCRSPGDSRAPQLESERKGSQRFYSRTNLKERSLSSGRIETGAIDLIAPAAAKFLSHPSGSPVMTPTKNLVAIPFNWEEAPGKPKAETAATEIYHTTLQLPPRLAAPSQKQGRTLQESLTSYNVRHSMSASLAGFNTTLLKIPSPSAPLRQYGTPKVLDVNNNLSPQSPSRCEAAPKELNQTSTASVSMPAIVTVSKAAAMESFLLKSKSVNERTRSPSRLLPGQLGGTAGDETAEKLRNSVFLTDHSSSQQKGKDPTSPTSILCGPDTGSQPSSNPSLSSNREMPIISATPTSHSNTNSTVSFDSLEQDSEAPSPAYDLPSIFSATKSSAATCPRSLPFRDFGPATNELFSPQDSVGGASDGVKRIIKLCKSGSRWVKTKKQPKLCTISSPEIWAPTLATYYQCNESPNSSEQHDSPAPILSQKSDSAGLPRSPHYIATSSRLPYLMPSVEKQQIGTVEAPNPDFSARLGGRFSSSRFASEIEQCSGFNSKGQLNKVFMPASSLGREEEGNRSPAYAATLELLSPGHQTRPRKRKLAVKSRVRRARRPKVRVRPRFLVSVCKALKTMFSRCSRWRYTKEVEVREKKLVYKVDYTHSPADFRFCKPN